MARQARNRDVTPHFAWILLCNEKWCEVLRNIITPQEIDGDHASEVVVLNDTHGQAAVSLLPRCRVDVVEVLRDYPSVGNGDVQPPLPFLPDLLRKGFHSLRLRGITNLRQNIQFR